MTKNIFIKQRLFKNWIILLQDTICYEFEKIEKIFADATNQKPKFFKKNTWLKSQHKNEGGGNFNTLKNGLVFEKVGVNISEVTGKFNNKLKTQVMGAYKKPKYWAAGISVVAHMRNPQIPAMHFNTRFIVTTQSWFGGGIDFTPCIKDLKEKRFFHNFLKKTCNKHDKKKYPKYKKWCEKYFFLKHRNEQRGIGGIFFDYEKKNWKNDFHFVRDVGLAFVVMASKIIKKKMFKNWNKKQKELQLIKRSRYVEFNLLYDRGTKFGLNTGGNIDAILMSLPPEAKWK